MLVRIVSQFVPDFVQLKTVVKALAVAGKDRDHFASQGVQTQDFPRAAANVFKPLPNCVHSLLYTAAYSMTPHSR
jgi:hypothetical protein